MWRTWPPWSRPWAARSTLASQLPFAASSRTPCATSAPRPAARWSPCLPGGPQPSAPDVSAGCGTTPPRNDCAPATAGRIARIATSPRIGTMLPLSASAPGASAPSRLSTRIAGLGIWPSTRPKTPRWPAAGAASPGWARPPNHLPTRCPGDAGSSPRPRQPRSTVSVRRGVLPRSVPPRHPARTPVRNPARPHLGTGPDGCPSGAASTATPMPPRSSLVATSAPGRSATSRSESLRVAETLRAMTVMITAMTPSLKASSRWGLSSAPPPAPLSLTGRPLAARHAHKSQAFRGTCLGRRAEPRSGPCHRAGR